MLNIKVLTALFKGLYENGGPFKYQVKQAKQLMTYAGKRYHIQNYAQLKYNLMHNSILLNLTTYSEVSTCSTFPAREEYMYKLVDLKKKYHMENWHFANHGSQLNSTRCWLTDYFTWYVHFYHKTHNITKTIKYLSKHEMGVYSKSAAAKINKNFLIKN